MDISVLGFKSCLKCIPSQLRPSALLAFKRSLEEIPFFLTQHYLFLQSSPAFFCLAKPQQQPPSNVARVVEITLADWDAFAGSPGAVHSTVGRSRRLQMEVRDLLLPAFFLLDPAIQQLCQHNSSAWGEGEAGASVASSKSLTLLSVACCRHLFASPGYRERKGAAWEGHGRTTPSGEFSPLCWTFVH